MNSTVYIETTENPCLLRMVWQENPQTEDIQQAFSELETAVNNAEAASFILVELPDYINFQIGQTVLEALPVYRNEQVAAWLVVNADHMAKVIARTLTYMSGRNNVHWFDTAESAIAYAERQQSITV